MSHAVNNQPITPSRGFDVFLSHNSREKAIIEGIAYRLRDKGIEPWLDKWYLVPGARWQGGLAEGLNLSASCAVFIGANNLGNWEWEELELAQDRAAKDKNFRLIPVLLPGLPEPFDPSILPPFLSTRMWVDFRRGVNDEEAFNLLVCAIRGVAPGPDDKNNLIQTPGGPGNDLCPYRGLQTFDETDADLFFGREGEIQRLIEKLKAARFLAVIGPSGSGKSSLVRAGLIPRLRRGGLPGSAAWPIHVLTPGRSPSQALSLFAASAAGKGDAPQATREVERRLQADDHALDFLLRTTDPAPDFAGYENEHRRVLVVDQFEEVFTLCENEQERRSFISNLLYAATNPESSCAVIISLRADFYPRCAAYAELSSCIASNQFIVSPMDSQSIRQVIEAPAARVGVRFEPGLVESILSDVVNQPGALPLLEHALLELWQSRRGDLLTLEGYEKSGGVKGAIARRADTIYLSFTPEQQSITRNLMLRLTQPSDGIDDTRRPVRLSELITGASQRRAIEEVIAAMTASRLLAVSADGQDGELLVNVSHEALIRGWPRLRQWIEEDRRGLRLLHQVSSDANEWRQMGEDESLLYRGLRLDQIVEWRKENNDSLNELERRFIDAGIEHGRSTESAPPPRRRPAMGGIILGMSLAGLVVVTYFFWQYFTAEKVAQVTNTQDQATPFLQSVMRGHTNKVTSISFSPDSRLVLSTSWDQTAQLWEARTGQVQKTLKGHTAWVTSGAFSSDGRFVVTAGWDHRIRVWDAGSGDQLSEITDVPNEDVKHISLSPDNRFILAVNESTGWVWELNSKRRLFELKSAASGSYGYGDETPVAKFSPDGKLILSSLTAKTAQLWDVSSGKVLFELAGHSNKIYAACFSHDGRLVATGSDDGTARIWEVGTGRELAVLRGHVGGVTVAVFSPDDKLLLTGSSDNTARLWDVSSGQTLSVLRGHTAGILDACFSPNGRFVVTASQDTTLRGWRVSGGHNLVEFRGHTNGVEHVVFSPDGNYIASTGYDRTVRVWAASSLRIVMTLPGHGGTVTGARFSRDGKLVVTASADRRAIVWDAGSGNVVFEARGHTKELNGATFSPDGKLIATASNDATARIWHINNGKVIPLLGHTDSVNAVEFSPDGKLVVTASKDNTAIVWDVQSGAVKVVLRGHTDEVRSASFSPDGKLIVTAGSDKTAIIWEVATGQKIAELRGHEGAVQSALFSPDGSFIVTGSADRTIRIWSSDDKLCTAVLRGHPTGVFRASISPNGKLIASAGAGNTARIWDLKQQRSIIELQEGGTKSHEYENPVYSADFSPDGGFVVTAGSGNLAIIWDVSDYEDK